LVRFVFVFRNVGAAELALGEKVLLEVRAQVREVLEHAQRRGQVHAHLRRELVGDARGDAPQRRRGEHRELAPRSQAGDVGDNLRGDVP
jgi:hypothetical protein